MDEAHYPLSTYSAMTAMHAGYVVAYCDGLMGVEVWMRQTGHRYAFCYAAITNWAAATYIQCDYAWRVVMPDEIPDDCQFEL